MDVTIQNLKDIKAGLDPHLEALSEKLGLQLKWGRGTYGASSYLKIEIAALSADGKAMTPEAKAFEFYCGKAGLAKEDLWGVFTTRDGKSYQIVGYNARAPKRPLLCKSMEDGRTYKFQITTFGWATSPKITREAAPTAG